MNLTKLHTYISNYRSDVVCMELENGIPKWDETLPNQQEIIDLIASYVALQNSQLDQIKGVISSAISFGNQIISEFAAQNVMMGITQEGMTGTVRKNMSEVINALQTGSLYDAIAEVKAIPNDKKDSKYITNARLLQFVNKIEDYLGIPRSTNL